MQKRRAPRLPRFKQRNAKSAQTTAGKRKTSWNLKKWKRVEADALGHRRAGRHADQHANGHQQQHRRQQRPVDREPPARKKPAVTSRYEHHGSPFMVMTMPGKLGNGFHEGIAADFKIGVVVKRGAGRRQQHHRIRLPGIDRIARRGDNRPVERAAYFERQPCRQRLGEFIRRLTDQVGLLDARKKRRERRRCRPPWQCRRQSSKCSRRKPAPLPPHRHWWPSSR